MASRSLHGGLAMANWASTPNAVSRHERGVIRCPRWPLPQLYAAFYETTVEALWPGGTVDGAGALGTRNGDVKRREFTRLAGGIVTGLAGGQLLAVPTHKRPPRKPGRSPPGIAAMMSVWRQASCSGQSYATWMRWSASSVVTILGIPHSERRPVRPPGSSAGSGSTWTALERPEPATSKRSATPSRLATRPCAPT
jgi:hypothetical protein